MAVHIPFWKRKDQEPPPPPPPPDAWGRAAAGVVVAGGATAATVHAANTWPEKFLQMLPFILFIILMAYAVYYAFIWKDPAEKQEARAAPPPAKKRGR